MEQLKLRAELQNLPRMVDFIRKGSIDQGFDDKTVYKIHLSCEEALVNIINYAYPDQKGNIEISYQPLRSGRGIILKIIDMGISFNPLEKPDPDLEVPLEEREIGGLGIFMIKQIMDKVDYKREDKKNILTLVKYAV